MYENKKEETLSQFRGRVLLFFLWDLCYTEIELL